MSGFDNAEALPRGAVFDDARAGEIRGALGTIRLGDAGRRAGPVRRLKTLLAILGPGLVVLRVVQLALG